MRKTASTSALIAMTVLTFMAPQALAQTKPSAPNPEATLTEKMNAYVGCINRLSERSYSSRSRYFSWANQNGPTGKERIIYGTYTIYDTSDSKLEPLLKEADDYYTQENYKDDKMAKGKAMHPRLVAAWDAFAKADKDLRKNVEAINDKRALQRLAAIEQSEGRKARYHVEALMIQAKRVLRAQTADKPDLAALTQALNDYETATKDLENAANADDGKKIGSMFTSSAKSYLTSAKQLMRRIRDKAPYSQGDKMMINAGSGWMIEGSPERLLRDYNQLIDAYNRGTRI